MLVKSFTLLLILNYLAVCNAIITIPLQKKARHDEQSLSSSSFLNSQNTSFVIDTLTNYNQAMYTGQIQIGTSHQAYSVDFDTGSNLLWITGPNCPSCIKDGYTNAYTCTTSDGCTQTQTTASISYGDGAAVSGYIVKVPIGIPGLTSVVESMLLVNKSVDNQLVADGLFGLGVYNEHNDQAVPYVSQLFKQGIIEKNEFSFYLGFGSHDSQLVFGGYDPSKVSESSQFSYTPIVNIGQKNDNQRWGLKVGGISLGSVNLNLSTKNIAIVDSGTSLIVLAETVYYQFMLYLAKNYQLTALNQGNEEYIYSVSCGTTLPDLNIVMKDTTGNAITYSIPSSFYLIKVQGMCIIGLMEGPDDGDIQFILGDIFMRRYLSVFSYTDLTVGLAVSVAQPPSSSGSFPTWAIIVIAVGGVLVIAAIAGCLWYRSKQRKNTTSRLQQQFIEP